MPSSNHSGQRALSLSISELAKKVLNQKYRLPHFQRRFEWPLNKRMSLFETLLDEWPFGALMLWSPPATASIPYRPFDFGIEWNREATTRPNYLVLDGQQRLATITQQYRLAEIPIEHWDSTTIDGRTAKCLMIDLNPGPEHDGETALWWSSTKKVKADGVVQNRSQIAVPLLLSNASEGFISNLGTRSLRETAKNIRGRLKEQQIHLMYMPSHSSLSAAIGVFERINREGTRLRGVDVSVVRLYELWSGLADAIATFADQVTCHPTASSSRDESYSAISRDRIISSLLFRVYGTIDPAQATRIARNPEEPQPSSSKIQREWTKVKEGYKRLRSLLANQLFLPSTKGIDGSYLSVAAHFFMNETICNSERQQRKLLHWLAMATICKPYTGGGTNNKINSDLTLISESTNPWHELNQRMSRNSGISPSDSDLLRTEHFGVIGEHQAPKSGMLHHLTYLSAHNQGARDWRTREALPSIRFSNDAWDRHHIFPKTMFTADESELRDHIGNLAWLTTATNRGYIKNKDPAEYIPELLRYSSGAEVLESQAVTGAFASRDQVEAFITTRIEKLRGQINTILDKWRSGHQPATTEIITEFVSSQEILASRNRENHRIEFKQSFEINAHGDRDERLPRNISKAVAAMANGGGGYILIGIREEENGDANVVGVAADIEASRAELPNRIRDYLTKHIQKRKYSIPPWVKIQLDNVDGKEVCMISVKGSPELVSWRKSQDHEWITQTRENASTSEPLPVVTGG